MSMTFPDYLSLSPYQRRAWAECLGRVIADIRERRGLSAAEAVSARALSFKFSLP
jgi:hypothetical protein